MGIAQLADYQSRATNNAYAQARQQAMQDRLAAAQAEQQFYNAQSQLSAKQQAAMAANREAAGKRDAAMIGRNVAQWEVDRQNKSNFEKQMFGLGVAGLGLAASPNYSWGGSNLGDSYNNAMGTYNNAMGSYNSSMFGPSGGGFSFNVPPPAPLALGNYNFLNPYGGQ
jgi:hypothetical protein